MRAGERTQTTMLAAQIARHSVRQRRAKRDTKEGTREGEEIKCVQVNLNRCHVPHDLLEGLVKERELEIALVSESNSSRAGAGWFTDM